MATIHLTYFPPGVFKSLIKSTEKEETIFPEFIATKETPHYLISLITHVSSMEPLRVTQDHILTGCGSSRYFVTVLSLRLLCFGFLVTFILYSCCLHSLSLSLQYLLLSSQYETIIWGCLCKSHSLLDIHPLLIGLSVKHL